jgi:hypothetical protein
MPSRIASTSRGAGASYCASPLRDAIDGLLLAEGKADHLKLRAAHE